MRLYTKTDLERCARLAVRNSETQEGAENPEWAVMDAVDTIVETTPEVFTHDQLWEAAVLAAQLDGSPQERALRAVNAVVGTRHFVRGQS